jgi:hypothetical protein
LCDIKYYECSIGIPIIHGGHGTKSFLPSCIPDLVTEDIRIKYFYRSKIFNEFMISQQLSVNNYSCLGSLHLVDMVNVIDVSEAVYIFPKHQQHCPRPRTVETKERIST